MLGTEGGYRDVAMIQDCDTAVSRICDMCGWTKDLKKLAMAHVQQQRPGPGEASAHKHNNPKTTTNHAAVRTTKTKEAKERYTSYKQTAKNKTDHTHRTKRTK